jgi:diacylglycerol kinase family enzyme
MVASSGHVLVLANPKAGARSGSFQVERLAELLRQRGMAVDVLTEVAELSTQSRRLFEQGQLRAAVAAGGDGTMALMVNHTPPGAPLAVLPLGTENLLSKYLGISPQPEKVCETICEGGLVQLDAGMAGNRIFLLMVGCGFDAEVVRRVHEARSGHIHHLSYAKPILDSIRTYQYPELRVRCHGPRGDEEIRAKWVFVVNLPRYAAGLQIVPNAVGSDGLLDVCTFKEGSLWDGLRYLSGILLGQHQQWEDCLTLRTQQVEILADEPVPFQSDGDPGGFLPVSIRVLPNRLTLLAPRDWLIHNGLESMEKSA